jgi:ferredoxin-like protein FixX
MPIEWDEDRGINRFPRLSLDEESDIESFRTYLSKLAPEALWDVQTHLDPDRYPRRAEAIHLEIERRRLLFVSPYTKRERRLRWTSALCLGCAVLTLLCHLVGSIAWEPAWGERLSLIQSLAVGGPIAARLLFPFARTVTEILLLIATVSFLEATYLRWHRRLSPEILVFGIVSLLLSSGLLALIATR